MIQISMHQDNHVHINVRKTVKKKVVRNANILERIVEICPKNKANDLFKSGMVGGPSIVFW